jgi:ABC-2 type transport system permease protein
MPFTYAYEALSKAAAGATFSGRFVLDVAVVIGVTLLAVAAGAATLRRRTP